VGYAGLEQNKASRKTALDTETGNPLNQSGTGYGIGIDYDFAQNFGIYLRHRWMEHKDKSFLLDQFSGQETVAEIKISF
jgi:opacity protein-like surface antigen